MMDIDEDRGLVIPTWPRRLERVPQRVVQLLNDDGFLFDSDMRRWRRRLKFYKEVPATSCTALHQLLFSYVLYRSCFDRSQ